MKLAAIGQMPAPQYGNPAIFRGNLAKFKARYPVMLFSSHPWPGVIKLKGDPDVVKGSRNPDGSVNQFAVNNLVFFTAMRIAQAHGITHVIYLEEDCRVGCDYWDEQIFSEFFNVGRPCIAGGTLATYNPCNFSPEAARRWNNMVRSNTRRNFPLATYGWMGAAEHGPTCVFPNGALGVYDISWIGELFNLDQTMHVAATASAWDLIFGTRLWERFKEDAYEVLGQINCIYSGYSDIVTTEEERKKMLLSGEVVAIHQVKSSWAP